MLEFLPAAYAGLPPHFYARRAPTPVTAPALVRFNHALATELGLDLASLTPDTLAAVFSGNALPAGTDPIATAYAGHQFGHFVPQLGDGRALLIGEALDRSGARREIQLKGAGRTPFSRGGDGRAALGPVLREYLVSEAMNALGVPATRALAAVTTGETVRREGPIPGAVFTRVARSHVRVGTFQFFAARGDTEAIRRLADFVIERHYPQLRTHPRPYATLLAAVAARQAALVARWLQVGFIHGVMNTDNMAVSGETIDFGPCAFMDAYDPATVFSSIDHGGRYAYSNQRHAAQWNLARFAETLLPLLDADEAAAVEAANLVILDFPRRIEAEWLDGMRGKLGLATAEAGDRALIDDLLARMHRHRADFTRTFRRLGTGAARAEFDEPAAFDEWQQAYAARLAREPGTAESRATAREAVNPAFIPRNHRIEQAIVAAVERGDLAPFERLLGILARPYADQPDAIEFQDPPQPSERVLQTFCGT